MANGNTGPDLDGKVYFVGGASSGMGRAVAIMLAKAGAQVIACARREKEGLETVALAGPNARFMQLDISDPEQVARTFAAIRETYGRLDGAVNNAAVECRGATIPDTELADFDQVIAVNLRGTFLCMQQEMAIMREQGSGAIVNVASIAAFLGFPTAAAYTASKHAILGLTRAASLELAAQGIRINALCPGGIKSQMSERWHEEGEAALHETVPMKRLSEPEDQAGIVMFLLSDAANYMTGASIVADGGYSVG